MKTPILLVIIAASTILMANLPLNADTRVTKFNSYTPKCGGGQITVMNPTGVDRCREAKDTSKAPSCLIVTPNQPPPSKQKPWIIKQTRGNDICKLKSQKISSHLYVNPKPVCEKHYILKVDSKGLQDRCIKSAKKYRIECKKDEAHLTKGLDKCIVKKPPL